MQQVGLTSAHPFRDGREGFRGALTRFRELHRVSHGAHIRGELGQLRALLSDLRDRPVQVVHNVLNLVNLHALWRLPRTTSAVCSLRAEPRRLDQRAALFHFDFDFGVGRDIVDVNSCDFPRQLEIDGGHLLVVAAENVPVVVSVSEQI